MTTPENAAERPRRLKANAERWTATAGKTAAFLVATALVVSSAIELFDRDPSDDQASDPQFQECVKDALYDQSNLPDIDLAPWLNADRDRAYDHCLPLVFPADK